MAATKKPPHPGQFKKGNQYGKMGGRPKRDPSLQEKCRALSDTCLERLSEIVRDDKAPRRDQLAAATLICAYAWGRPKILADISVEHDLSKSFLLALQEINNKANPDEPKVIDVTPERKNGGATDGLMSERKVFNG